MDQFTKQEADEIGELLDDMQEDIRKAELLAREGKSKQPVRVFFQSILNSAVEIQRKLK